MFKWLAGRQPLGGYFKMLLLESKRFKFDVWLLKFPKGSFVGDHIDPATEGYEHHRLNILLYGKPGKCYIKHFMVGKEYLLRFPPYRWWRFRPDVQVHGALPAEHTRYILSIGWLKKC